ncbi:hypothetical protein A9513_002120 [Pseudomonas sp. AU12215]|nr:hypothetical protein A9513_002120 [Pseudomonas sp. AU12215]
MNRRRYLKIRKDGIQVVIPRLAISSYFPYAEDGQGLALVAAIKFRDETLAVKGQTSLLRSIPHIKPKAGSSPLAGVFLSVQARGPGQKPKAAFMALYTNESGESRKKSFGIAKLGYLNAFRKAAQFRVEKNNLQIDWESMQAPRPNAQQYSLICSLADDIPLPRSENARPAV